MNYDVPLPPCVERRRQRRRELLEDDNRAYARVGWPLRELDAATERWWIADGIDGHCSGPYCEACDNDHWWPIWFSGRGPDTTPDVGTYVDAAGHRLVELGLWESDQVKTAAQIAADTSQGMLGKKERKNG